MKAALERPNTAAAAARRRRSSKVCCKILPIVTSCIFILTLFKLTLATSTNSSRKLLPTQLDSAHQFPAPNGPQQLLVGSAQAEQEAAAEFVRRQVLRNIQIRLLAEQAAAAAKQNNFAANKLEQPNVAQQQFWQVEEDLRRGNSRQQLNNFDTIRREPLGLPAPVGRQLQVAPIALPTFATGEQLTQFAELYQQPPGASGGHLRQATQDSPRAGAQVSKSVARDARQLDGENVLPNSVKQVEEQQADKQEDTVAAASNNLVDRSIEPRQRRRLFARILKKAEWNHIFVEVSKVFLQHFLEMALKDIIGKQSGASSTAAAGTDSTSGRKKLDVQSELADLLRDIIKNAISNI